MMRSKTVILVIDVDGKYPTLEVEKTRYVNLDQVGFYTMKQWDVYEMEFIESELIPTSSKFIFIEEYGNWVKYRVTSVEPRYPVESNS